jgi:hypothetical protein
MGNCNTHGQQLDQQYETKSLDMMDIKPLDLVLVYGGNNLISRTVSCFEKNLIKTGDWTHTGIIITPEIVPIKNGIPGKKYIWESAMGTKEEPRDVETGEVVYNIQVKDLEEYVEYVAKNSSMRISVCRLRHNPMVRIPTDSNIHYMSRIKVIRDILATFYEKINNAPYDIVGFSEPVWSCLTCGQCNCLCDIFDRNDGAFICSAFVGRVYQLLGIFDGDIEVDTLFPCSYLTDNRINSEFDHPIMALP